MALFGLYGPIWPIWPRMAPFVHVWARLAQFGPIWPVLAESGPVWPGLASGASILNPSLKKIKKNDLVLNQTKSDLVFSHQNQIKRKPL